MLYTDFENKNVIALDTAELLGTVKGAYVDFETYDADYLIVSGEKTRVLPISQIVGRSDTITVMSENKLLDEKRFERKLFYANGLIVVDTDGKNYGISTELYMRASKRNKIFLADDKRIQLRSVISASDDYIVINPRYKTISTYAEEERHEEPISEDNHEEAAPESFPTVEGTAIATYTDSIPDRPINDYGFLLGRRVNRDITDLTRTFMIKSGTLINERVIASCRKAGKLVELTLNSK